MILEKGIEKEIEKDVMQEKNCYCKRNVKRRHRYRQNCKNYKVTCRRNKEIAKLMF